MAFISRFQFYFYDPLDVIDLVLMAYNAGVINHTPLYDGKNILARTKSPIPLPQPHLNSHMVNP